MVVRIYLGQKLSVNSNKTLKKKQATLFFENQFTAFKRYPNKVEEHLLHVMKIATCINVFETERSAFDVSLKNYIKS